MNYITNTSGILIVFDNGYRVRVEKSDRRYPKIVKVFSLPKEEQEQAVKDILDPKKKDIKEIVKQVEGFDVMEQADTGEQEIWYKGEALPAALSNKILSIIADGLPVDYFVKFWENLEQNPSSKSVEELIEFLQYKELPITEDGCFLAYKGVQDNYYSSHGNLKTKVLQGKVDDAGRIWNGVGETIEVRRRDVDDNREQHCSHGLHVGSLDYARGFASRLVVVKVDPKDVVSIPSDCSCQKARVTKYKVVADFEEEIKVSVVDEDGDSTIVTDDVKERNEFVDRIRTYLDNKRENEDEQVSIRQIQNAMSPYWATKEQVLDALQELGEYWEEQDGIIVVLL